MTEEEDPRVQACVALVEAYTQKYGNSFIQLDASDGPSSTNFYLDPAIEFRYSPQRGVGLYAMDDMEASRPLLVIPKEEGIGIHTANANKKLKKLLHKMEMTYDSKAESNLADTIPPNVALKECFSCHEVKLLVIIMKGLADAKQNDNNNNKDNNTLFHKVVQTWPSLDELQQGGHSIWELRPQVEPLLRGTNTYIFLHNKKTIDQFVFDHIIGPVIQKGETSSFFLPSSSSQEQPGESTKTKDLWTLFRHASLLLRSRAHEEEVVSSTTISHREPVIYPIIDLLNGHPYGYQKDGHNALMTTTTNGNKHSGGGGKLLMSTRPIAAGEEITHSYGVHSASSFIDRYGCCPADYITTNGRGLVDDIALRVPGILAPPDDLRTSVARHYSLPTTPEETEQMVFQVAQPHYDKVVAQLQTSTAVVSFEEQWHEVSFQKACPPLSPLRDFLAIGHVFDDTEVKAFQKDGSFRSYSFFHMSHVFQLVIDHVLTQVTTLSTSTNEEDLVKSRENNLPSDLVVAYRARICQRDALARWRHAFCWFFGFPSEHSEPAFGNLLWTFLKANQVQRSLYFVPRLPEPRAPSCLIQSQGCRLCGRTLHLKSCSRCKRTKYCCAEHQKKDWKVHKKLCKEDYVQPNDEWRIP